MTGFPKAEIWLVDLSGARGHEQKCERPAVIWRDLDHAKMAIAIPLTSVLERAKFAHTHLVTPTLKNCLDADSVALVFQITSIDKVRMKKKIGELDESDAKAIASLIKDMLRV